MYSYPCLYVALHSASCLSPASAVQGYARWHVQHCVLQSDMYTKAKYVKLHEAVALVDLLEGLKTMALSGVKFEVPAVWDTQWQSPCQLTCLILHGQLSIFERCTCLQSERNVQRLLLI